MVAKKKTAQQIENNLITGREKAMISQPMNGLEPEEIADERDRAIQYLEEHNYEVVDTYFSEGLDVPAECSNQPIFYLSKAIEKMSQCDAVYFVKGWKKARGCSIEHAVANNYGLKIIYGN